MRESDVISLKYSYNVFYNKENLCTHMYNIIYFILLAVDKALILVRLILTGSIIYIILFFFHTKNFYTGDVYLNQKKFATLLLQVEGRCI